MRLKIIFHVEPRFVAIKEDLFCTRLLGERWCEFEHQKEFDPLDPVFVAVLLLPESL